MNLNEFISEHDNTYVHFDKVWGAQCMDLFRVYVEKVLKFNQTPLVRNAYAVWLTNSSDFERIKNAPDNFPLPGDIVIWHWRYGGTGHIAIAVDGCTSTKLICFSQNDPTNSKARIREYKNYNYVLGWLRPRNNVVQ
jgi:hypothetical protein